jgi:hypothetical protein
MKNVRLLRDELECTLKANSMVPSTKKLNRALKDDTAAVSLRRVAPPGAALQPVTECVKRSYNEHKPTRTRGEPEQLEQEALNKDGMGFQWE